MVHAVPIEAIETATYIFAAENDSKLKMENDDIRPSDMPYHRKSSRIDDDIKSQIRQAWFTSGIG